MSGEHGVAAQSRAGLDAGAAQSEAALLERDRAALRRALILGTSRRPIEVPAWLAGETAKAGELAIVAALSVRSRFDRPAVPQRLGAAGFEHDPERLVGDTARAALRRLYGTKKRTVPRAVSLHIIDVLRARGLCLHPFDYPALTELLATNDDALDRNARLWRSLLRAGGARGAGGASDAGGTGGAGGAGSAGSGGMGGGRAMLDDVDDANWTELRPAQRAAFLRDRRRQDPAAARALLASTIAGETATVRRQLLEAMTVALSAADAEFLRGLATDRAESVRNLARTLIASIPGTPEFDERVASAHERLELKSVGVIGRRKVLTPKLPKGLIEAKTEAWLHEAFAGVSAAALARSLKLAYGDFAGALADERLRAIFLGNALALGEHEVATAFAPTLALPEAWRVLATTHDALAALEPERRGALWRAFAPAIASASFAEGCSFAGELYEIVRMPAPSTLMEPSRTAKPWVQWLDTIKSAPDAEQPDVPELAIALADRAHRSVWRERLSALSPGTAFAATALADFFDALDAQSPAHGTL